MSITSVVNDLATSVSVINALKPLPPTISGYSVGGLDDTALDPAGGQTVQINGTGFLPGATITFDGSAVAVVTYVNPNRLTFTSPAKSAGTYTIYVVNSDGGTAIFIPGIIYSVLPTWTTAAGSLGSYYETTSISNTVVASGDAPITYSLFSGSLPTGATLYANGVITGTAPVDSSSTTYSFTIQATDAQLQDSTRSFSLTINVDAVTWVSPANATTYTSAVDSAIANVTLSATDAAGYAVSYSANALPTGLSLTGANISGTPTVIADSSTLLTATAATTNRTAIRTINWSITVANDPFFEYNTLLIPGASTTFVDDASTNNFAVTINGDTKPNSFNPYTPGYYSVFMNGGSSGDLLSFPNSSTAYNLSSGSGGTWTVEMWMYPTMSTFSDGDCRMLMAGANGNNTAWQLFIDSNRRIGWNVPAGGIVGIATANSAFSFNTWTHVAVVCQAGSARIYVNGVSAAGPTSITLPVSGGASIGFKIGFDNVGTVSTQFAGFISNVRINLTTAIYTATFTPSTIPLTAVSGTSLLTCQSNRYLDTSTNALSVTVAGSPRINSFDPFVPNSSYSTYGSGYFDGTGDFVTVAGNTNLNPGTGDFTVEAWCNVSLTTGGYRAVYIIGPLNDDGLYYNATDILWYQSGIKISGGGLAKANTWQHLAASRSSGTTRLFVNGSLVGSYSDSYNYNYSSPTVGSSLGGGSEYFTGYISNVRFVKGTAVYTTAFTPPAAPLTAIANTGLLTLQNNQSVNNSVFLDNSTNNFFVTRAGNTTQGTFSPYGGNWSNYFDGTGDYLSFLNNAVFAFGTGSFTIEFWINGPLASDKFFLTGRAAIGTMHITTGGTGSPAGTLRYVGTSTIFSSNVIMDNTWHHCAIVRNGSSNITLYVDGVSVGTGTDTSNYTNTTGTWYIASNDSGPPSNILTGYISNLRIVKGTALYTSNFTPSTTPLTAITNTSLLTCADNRFIDDSINNFAITKIGDTSVQRFSPFNPSLVTPTSYSGYFDGTGDYLSGASWSSAGVFGTSDFTVECWVYATGAPQSNQLIWGCNIYPNTTGLYLSYFGSGGNNLGLRAGATTLIDSSAGWAFNTWLHVAVVRSGSTLTLYINGTSRGSTTFTNNCSDGLQYIGRPSDTTNFAMQGSISNFRIVKGVAVYTGAFTVPTTPLTSTQSSGTNIAAITGTATSLLTLQSTTFIDNSTNNFTITAVGNSQPTIQNPFGFTSATTEGYTVSTIGGSGYFDGTGDYLEFANNSILLFGSNNFTIEAWVYPTKTGEATIINKLWQGSPVYASYVLYIESGNTFRFLASTSGGSWEIDTGSSTTVMTPNSWYHTCVVRNGSTFSLYINGKLERTTTNAGALYAHTGPLRIGAAGPATGNGPYFQGYMSDPRMINGTALYTSSFVPPAAPILSVQNTVLLNNMTSAGIYDAAMMTTMETVADAKLSTAVSKFGGSSMSFDGTGDYLTAPFNPSFNLGAGNFTIEFWVNTTSTAAYATALRLGDTWTTGSWSLYLNDASGNGYPSWWSFTLNTALTTSGALINNGVWHHIALVRNGTTMTMYIDGTSRGTLAVSTSSVGDTTTKLWIARDASNVRELAGYLDDLRITKYARYTTNFTAPTTAFPIY